MLGKTTAPRVAAHYGVALLAVAAALGARALMEPLLDGDQPFVTLFGAIAVAVWFGGYGPALLAAATGWFVANALFVPPATWASPAGAAGMLAYAVSAVLIVGFGQAMRQAREGATSYRLELVERQRRLAAILESISDAFYAVDRDWRFVYINTQAERYFGRPKHEILGATVWSVFPGAVDTEVEAELRRAMEEETPVAFEVRAPTAQRWLEIRAYPSAEGLSVYFRDVQDRKEAEAALVLAKVEAEQRAEELEKAKNILHTIFEHVPEGIALTGGPPDFPIVMHSRYGRELMAAADERLLHQPAGQHVEAWRIFLPDGKTRPPPEQMPLYRAGHHGEFVKNVEFVVEGKGGSLVPVLVNAAPVRNRQGEIVGAINCWRDVSDVKLAYARIEAAQHRLQVVADSVPALISYVDRDLRYRLVNRTFEAWFGVPRAQFEGRHVKEMLGEAAWRTLEPHAGRALRGESVSFETHALFRDGEKRWLSVTYRPDVREDGTVHGYVGHAMDVTASKRTQAALNRNIDRLGLLWEAAAVLLSTDEPKEMLHRVFDSIAPHLGLDAYISFMAEDGGEALVLESSSGIPDADLEQLRRLPLGAAICGAAAVERRPIVIEQAARSDDPRVAHVRAMGFQAYVCHPLVAGERLLGTLSFASRTRPAWDGDELDFLRTVAHYVTLAYERLRLLAQLRDADRRKDEFLSLLAHELRNPLAPVRNGLQLMLMPGADERTRRTAIEMMERQISLMVRLIDDLLDVSRITRGKVELQLQHVQLRDVIMQGVETVRPQLESMAQEITVSVPVTAVWLEADPLRLAQVVSNLLNNASKFTDRGGRIWITAGVEAGLAVIRVKDTGIGIPRDKLRSIFDMFVQADPSATRRHSGLGLGLTLVKSLVEMHHGTVTAHSEGPDRGAEFIVTLPVVAHAPAPAATLKQESKDMASRRILVIDDSADSAESLGMLLTMMGHEVRTSLGGQKALELAAGFRPQLVMCDIGMPGMSGFELAPRLRGELGDEARLVALTGYGSEDDRRRTREAGFDDHLVKPVDLDALRGVLGETAEGRA